MRRGASRVARDDASLAPAPAAASGPDGPRDVFERFLAEVRQPRIEPSLHVFVGCARNADAAGRRDAFKSRGDTVRRPLRGRPLQPARRQD